MFAKPLHVHVLLWKSTKKRDLGEKISWNQLFSNLFI